MSGSASEDFDMEDVREINEHLFLKSSKSPAPAPGTLPPQAPETSVDGDSTSSESDDESESAGVNDVDVISVSSDDDDDDESVEVVDPAVVVKSEILDANRINVNGHTSRPPSVIPQSGSVKPPSSASASASAKPHSSVSAKPASSVSAATPTATASAKPKSTKVIRARSRSPTPPPPPPPLQTIRLNIKLGGPDNYEVDISNMAKETGQRPPTPVLVKRDLSDSEGEDEGEGDEKVPEPQKDDKPAVKKRKRKNAAAEYYDVHDPFIDDSELALDERTYFAQTKQQGFYVSSGEVALMKDKTPKKPKSKKPGPQAKIDAPGGAQAGPSTHITAIRADGTRDSPIALGSDDDENVKPGQKRKRYTTVVENGKKRRLVNIHDFHPELQQSIEELRVEIVKENWENKGKFPPGIKPLLAQVALKAVELDEYDDHFFNLMPTLFPYNKFTMSKLIKRTIFTDHLQLLNQRQDRLLKQLKTITTDGFVKAQEDYEKSVVQWAARQEKLKDAEARTGDSESISAAPIISAQQSEDAGSGMDQDPPPPSAMQTEAKDVATAKGEPHPPAQRYRMTEQIKSIIWQLVSLSNACCALENEKNTLEGSTLQVSEQGLRKALYQKIVAAFPEGWMNSGQISRDVSAMKKKHEKEAMENEG